MDRRGVLAVVAGALVALLLVAVASSGSVRLAERGPSMPFDLPILDFSDTAVDLETSGAEEGDVEPTEASNLPANLRSYLMNLGVLAFLALMLRGARRAWRQRPDLIWRTTPQRDDFAVLEEIAVAVTADAAAQRAALERGEARNAIVACWSRLEHLAGDAGFQRDPADTAAEFTARVLSSFPVDPAAIADLAALYREARFSTHPMGEPERASAIDALDAIHAGLRISTIAAATS